MKVSNVSLGASQQDIKEFFSFSGDIVYVEMQRLVWFSLLMPWFFVSECLNFLTTCLILTSLISAWMSNLKLHMLPSKIHKEQRLRYFFRCNKFSRLDSFFSFIETSPFDGAWTLFYRNVHQIILFPLTCPDVS